MPLETSVPTSGQHSIRLASIAIAVRGPSITVASNQALLPRQPATMLQIKAEIWMNGSKVHHGQCDGMTKTAPKRTIQETPHLLSFVLKRAARFRTLIFRQGSLVGDRRTGMKHELVWPHHSSRRRCDHGLQTRHTGLGISGQCRWIAPRLRGGSE